VITLDLQVACQETELLPNEAEIMLWLNAALKDQQGDLELTIRLVDSKESQDLNRMYRGKDTATNVLSFPFESPVSMPLPLLGDLVICKQVVEIQAKQQNKTNSSHWAHMVVHGCLHLLGYDHTDKNDALEMESLEIAIMESLDFDNPYLEGQENG